jgi:hypothetical protein
MFEQVNFSDVRLIDALAEAYAVILRIKLPEEEQQSQANQVIIEDQPQSLHNNRLATQAGNVEYAQLSMFSELIGAHSLVDRPKRQRIEGKRRTGG